MSDVAATLAEPAPPLRPSPGPPRPAVHGKAALLRFVVGTGLANALGLLWSALVGRWLGAAGSADYFAALFVLQAVYMAGHPLNGVLARVGAADRNAGRPGRALALVRWLAARALVVGAAVALVVALTFAWQASALHFDDRVALALGWIGGGVALGLGLLRGALRGAGLLGALALNFNIEALARLLVGATLIGALAAWWAGDFGGIAGIDAVTGAAAGVRVGAARGLASRAVAAHLTAALVAAALAWTWLWRRLRAAPGRDDEVDGAGVRALLTGMVGLAVADALWQNADALLAKNTLDAVAAGHYGAVATLVRLFAVLVQPFALLVIPILVEESAQGRAPGAALGRLLAVFVALATVAIAVLALWPQQAVVAVFGAGFAAAAPLVAPQALGALCCYSAMMLGQAFAAAGRFGFLLIHALGLLALGALGLWASDGVALATAQAAVKAVVLVALIVAWWRHQRVVGGDLAASAH